MAMNKTRYGRQCVLNHFFGRNLYTFQPNIYLALFTSDPTELGLLTDELTQLGYARVEISALMGDASAVSGAIANAGEIVFGPSGEDWPEITHAGVIDGVGLMVYFGPAVTSRVVSSGDDYKIKIGQLTINEK